ncbi:hypothetical protein J4E81_006208 [Alternaria sp. BMP 2799]|nr:hypothetical protein J4E81_006208 [Alternaria sp. BMP 2799]
MKEDVYGKIEEDAQRIWNESRFDPRKVGEEQARQNTSQYLEGTEFHFRDAKANIEMFLKGRFPCGIRACDKIKHLRVYIRCEEFLNWAGWDEEDEDCGDAGAQETDEDFPWEERENNVYDDKVYRVAKAFSRIPFPSRPHITIVIVTPFGLYGAEGVEEERVLFNFIEATLEPYHDLKSTGATVTVSTIKADDAEEEHASTASALDFDITWLYELEEQKYKEVRWIVGWSSCYYTDVEQRWNAREYPRYAYPKEPAPPHYATLLARSHELHGQRLREGEDELQRRVAIWRNTAPGDMDKERRHLNKKAGTVGTAL